MNCHLIRWNPNTSKYKLEDFASDFINSKFIDGLENFSWELNKKENIETGDIWILLCVGTSTNGIAALGYFIDQTDIDWNNEKKDTLLFD